MFHISSQFMALQVTFPHVNPPQLFIVLDDKRRYGRIYVHVGENVFPHQQEYFRLGFLVGELKYAFKSTSTDYANLDFNKLFLCSVAVMRGSKVQYLPGKRMFLLDSMLVTSARRIGDLDRAVYEQVAMHVCKYYGNSIKYVVEPTTDMYIMSLKRTGYTCWDSYRDVTSKKFWREAVKHNPYMLMACHHQTEALCLLAVALNGMHVDAVKDKTPLVCQVAYASNPKSMRYTRHLLFPPPDVAELVCDFFHDLDHHV